jgi:enterochelin esterase-like enzyme
MKKNCLLTPSCILIGFFISLFISACAGSRERHVQPLAAHETDAVSLLATPTQATSYPALTPSPQSTLTVTATAPKQTYTASPTAAPSPDPSSWRCWQNGGHFEHHQLAASELLEPLEFRVYLPPCYEAEPERRYPVLYLLHGQSYLDDQWQRLGAGDTADRLIAKGEITPFLIVMPRYRLWSDPDVNNFGAVMIQSLIPWIDANYRTQPDRNFRAVGGLSKGAGWAVHLGLTSYDTFAAIGGHSLAVFWSDTYQIRSWLEEIPPEMMPRIFLDIGEKDRPQILSSAVWFEEILTLYKIPHEWYLLTGYHDESYWSANMERYLRWYGREW